MHQPIISRSSPDELLLVLAEPHGRWAAHVLFLASADVPSDRWATTLWRAAAQIPGVTPAIDRGGALQDVFFGTLLSGSVAVYETTGLEAGRRVHGTP
jgi:hypothetical protein